MVDQSEAVDVLGRKRITGHDHFGDLLRSHPRGKLRRQRDSGHPPLGLDNRERGILGGDDDVAFGCENQAGAVTIAMNGGDNGLPVDWCVQIVMIDARGRKPSFLACSRSTAWLLALMKSADRFPDHVNALG